MDVSTYLWLGAAVAAVGFTGWLFWPSKQLEKSTADLDGFIESEYAAAKVENSAERDYSAPSVAEKLAAIDFGAETAKVAILNAVPAKKGGKYSSGVNPGRGKKPGKKLAKQVKRGAKPKKVYKKSK